MPLCKKRVTTSTNGSITSRSSFPLIRLRQAQARFVRIEIQRVIDNYPRAFLQYDSLPEGLLRLLHDAARPAVPMAARPVRMQGPPLGELPLPLQPGQWRRLFDQVTTSILNSLGYRQGRET